LDESTEKLKGLIPVDIFYSLFIPGHMNLTKILIIPLMLIIWLSSPAFAVIPQCSEARTWLHKGMLLHDNSDQEIEYYQKAVELCPSLVSVYNRIGEIYKKRGAIQKAQKAFRMAEPTVEHGNNTILGNAHSSADDIESSAGQTTNHQRAALSRSRQDYTCEEGRKWLHMGLFLHDNSDNEIFFYQRAVELCWKLVPVYNRIAEIYRERGNEELAKQADLIAEGKGNVTILLTQFPIVAPRLQDLYLRKDIIAQYKYYQPEDTVPLPEAYALSHEEKTYDQYLINAKNIDCVDGRNWLHLGFFLHDDSDKEISYYQKAVEQCTDLIPSYNRIGEIYNKRGDINRSQKAFQIAQARVDTTVGKTEELDRSGQASHPSVIGSQTRRLIKKGLNGPVYASISGDELKFQTDLTTSFEKISADITIQPDNCDEARKWYKEGLTLRDNTDREASYYKQAISLCKDYGEAFNQLGIVYKNQGKYQDAIEAFRSAKEKALLSDDKQQIVKPAVELGEIFRRQSKLQSAVDEFENVLDIDPNSRIAQNQLDYLYKRMGKYDDVTEPPLELLTNATFTRISGMTLPEGTYLADLQYEHWVQRTRLTQDLFSDEIFLTGAPLTTNTDVNNVIWGLRYGLTNRFTVGIIQHYSFRTAHVPNNTLDVETTPQVDGLGDTVLLGKYLVWGVRQTNFSAYTQLSIPTGDENAKGEDLDVVRNMPLGSGSYDVTVGLAFSAGINLKDIYPSLADDLETLTFHAHTSYTFTDGIQVGDEFHLDLALSYPLRDYITYDLELNYRWRDETIRYQTITIFQDRPETIGPSFDPVTAGTVDVDTTYTDPGGHTLFFSPSLQFKLDTGLKLELGVEIPLKKPYIGMSEDLVYHLGLTKFLY